MWIARLGLQLAMRHPFTGDEITSTRAAELGLALECVPDEALLDTAMELAQRMALLPLNQLQMMKLLCHQATERTHQPATSRLLGCLFDGIARHTPEVGPSSRPRSPTGRCAPSRAATHRSVTTPSARLSIKPGAVVREGARRDTDLWLCARISK